MNRLLFLLTFVLINLNSFAQIKCGTDELYHDLMLNDIEYKSKRDETIDYLKKLQITNYKTVNTGSGTEYHVPVVVHVIHTGGAVGSNYNPTDANINLFINRINDGFANMVDENSIPGTFNSVNIPIRFFLAQRNELASCSATTGINRINNSSNATYNANGVGSPGITDLSLKSLVHWNDLDYYNIYIVNKINGVDGYCTGCTFTAGYASLPVLGGSKQDGMVVLAQQVNGTSNTFIHEMGHAFNLYHPFEGGSSSTCPPVTTGGCTVDNDEVCDTDPVRLDFTCNPSGSNPCGGSWSSSTTQFNYMAYFGCNDRFTPEQATRINGIMNNVRTSYKNSAGLDTPPSSLPTFITAPTFNAANTGNSFGMGPKYVQLNGIEYTSSSYSFEGAGSVYYVDHTCNQATNLIINHSYPITVKTATNVQKVRVYIDYNGDGTFGTTAPELVFSSNATSANFTHSGTVVIPSSSSIVQLSTPLRMRVIADNASTITPTMQLNAGQAEDYMVTILPAALPVMWRSFSAQLNEKKQAQLRWVTEMETNNAFFEIEKSTDGISFQTIIKLEGAGNSNQSKAYSYTDMNVSVGFTYYRIKQIDDDGNYTYSEIKSVFVNDQLFTVNVFPNPIQNNLTVQVESAKQDRVGLALYNVNGSLLWTQEQIVEQGSTSMKFVTENLPTGIYILRVKNSIGVQSLRIVK